MDMLTAKTGLVILWLNWHFSWFFFVVSYSQCNVLTGHHCVLEIIWSVISWYLYHLSFQKNMGVLNLFLCVYMYWLGPLWSWSYDILIYNYLCNRCLSPLTFWVRIPLRWGVLDTTLCDKVCQWIATGRWFSLGTPVSSTNKTDRHDINEIWLTVAWNTLTLTETWYFIFFLWPWKLESAKLNEFTECYVK
jgi:hypothetical protein